MSNYILGSHNTWSYRKPLKWLMRPFHFIGKCQSKTLKEQYIDYDVQLFDLRMRWHDDLWYLAHGSMIFNITVAEAMAHLELLYKDNPKKVYVRVLLEYNEDDVDSEIITKFKTECAQLVTDYPQFTFVCGKLKSTWETLYDFGNDITIEEKYSSVTSLFDSDSKLLKVVDDWYPRLYAKLNNADIYKEGTDKECLLIDFVDIGYENKE